MPWTQAFPDRGQTVLVVVEARAPEFADAAANALTAALKADPKEFVAVSQPAGGPFFEHNGLLFPSTDEVLSTTSQLVQSRPLVNALAHDPSLTGLAGTLTTSLLLPLQLGQVKLGRHEPFAVAKRNHARSRAGRPAGGVLVARAGRQERRHRAGARLRHRAAGRGLRRAGAGRDRVESDPRHRRLAAPRCALRRHGPSDRRTAARGRRIRIGQGRRRAQRHRHLHRRAGHSVAGAAFGPHDRRRVHHAVRRARDHRGARPDAGGRAQHDFGRLHGAVRRARGRFRRAVRRQIS